MQLKVLMIIAGLATFATLTSYTFYLKERTKRLEANAAIMRNAIDEQQAVLGAVYMDLAKVRESMVQLEEARREQTARLHGLNRAFSKGDRDFGFLAFEKPVLVGNVINRASAARLVCIEAITHGDMKHEACDHTGSGRRPD
jgi:hypothetical protein